MRLGLVALLLAACGTNGTGTVVYSAFDGHIAVVDVASGTSTDLDLGMFGGVAISPDARYVSYIGLDNLPKINDRKGNVTPLASTNGCFGSGTWRTNNALTYCVISNVGLGMVGLMPRPGAPARQLSTNTLGFSNDGARIAYVENLDPSTSLGNLVVENVDGAERTVLLEGIQVGSLSFLPDDSGLVFDQFPNVDPFAPILQVVSFADHTRRTLGNATLVQELPGGSRISPNGHEVLALDGSKLVGFDLTTGAARTYTVADPSIGQRAAVYLDDGRVLIGRDMSVFEGDAGISTQQLMITDGTDSKIVQSTDNTQCSVVSLSRDVRQIGVTCSVPAVLDFSGAVVLGKKGQAMVGLSSDGNGLITIDELGFLVFTSTDGSSRQLAETTAFAPGATSLPTPYAAYAP